MIDPDFWPENSPSSGALSLATVFIPDDAFIGYDRVLRTLNWDWVV
jgi:hypothetical protein